MLGTIHQDATVVGEAFTTLEGDTLGEIILSRRPINRNWLASIYLDIVIAKHTLHIVGGVARQFITTLMVMVTAYCSTLLALLGKSTLAGKNIVKGKRLVNKRLSISWFQRRLLSKLSALNAQDENQLTIQPSILIKRNFKTSGWLF